MTEHITPRQLKERLDRHEALVLLDVRDGWEVALSRLANAVHIPMDEIELRADELSKQDDIVVYCHHGVRSAAVADYLRQLGYGKAVNLAGGIDEWARQVEPGMRRY